MDDYISRQEAIDVCNYAIDLWHGQLGEGIVIAVRKKIAELPSVQPEIIRCKDCKFYTAYDYTGKLMCKRIGKGMILPKPEDFCSYAERITDEQTDER